jgi:Ca2+-binding EF-hand superfamily protein
MLRPILAALPIAVLLAGNVVADDKEKKDKEGPKPTTVTITKVDVKKGEITVKYNDDKGKEQQKTFQLTKDVKILDESGKVIGIDVFESGNDALIVETEGKLRELRRAGHVAQPRRLSDQVRTLIELTDCEEGCTEDLQRIYDMLRKLDTAHNGKLDPKAVKAEADRILEERVKAVFDRLDTNKDAKISKEEAKGLVKEHFDKIDTNKDGYITYEELLKAAKEKRESKATETKQPDKEKK